MTSPKDTKREIPGDIWAAADAVLAQIVSERMTIDGGAEVTTTGIDIIANAIMAATLAERGAIAVLCDGVAGVHMDIAERSLSVGSREEYAAKSQTATSIAAAIRKRSEA